MLWRPVRSQRKSSMSSSKEPGRGWRPSGPIAIYNPFESGGRTDLHIRMLAESVGSILGQKVLVKSHLGAAYTYAPSLLFGAVPDGLQLAVMSTNSVRYAQLYATGWHPLRDFTYIVGLSGYSIGVVVREDAPWRTLEEFIAAAKTVRGKYGYASGGSGGAGHVTVLDLEHRTGATFTHIPLRGTAEWDKSFACRRH